MHRFVAPSISLLVLGLSLNGCVHAAAPAALPAAPSTPVAATPENAAVERAAIAVQVGELTHERRLTEALPLYRRLWELGERRPKVLYAAACAAALCGERQEALAWLERAADAGLDDPEHLTKDPDLASLRDAPAYAQVLERVKATSARMNAAAVPALRDEVLARVKVDQEARAALFANGQKPTPEKLERLRKIDEDNTRWMKEVLARHGWPTRTLVGQKASKGAWLLTQHADHDRAFQKEALALLEKAVAAGEADGRDFAYLTDRVLVAEGRPQRYGTQFIERDGVMVPQPTEDAGQLDARRASVGLDTMAEYAAQMERTYRKPASPTPLSVVQ